MKRFPWQLMLCGLCAGAVTGLFGAGGGMVLIPLLSRFTNLNEEQLFPASISIILPICIVTLIGLGSQEPLPFSLALPYLAGSVLGGLAARPLSEKIPVKWLHRLLGILIIWGGLRYLCS